MPGLKAPEKDIVVAEESFGPWNASGLSRRNYSDLEIALLLAFRVLTTSDSGLRILW